MNDVRTSSSSKCNKDETEIYIFPRHVQKKWYCIKKFFFSKMSVRIISNQGADFRKNNHGLFN